MAWGARLLVVASVFLHTNSRVLDSLKHDSEFLQHQLEQYGPISKNFATIFAYETYPTHLPIGSTVLVSPDALLEALPSPFPKLSNHNKVLMLSMLYIPHEPQRGPHSKLAMVMI